jgi:hypothetical protein
MMPPTATPGQMASLAQSMARNAEGKDAQMFQKIALVSMGVMAFASVAQVALELLKKKSPCYDRSEAVRHQR